MLSIGDMLAVGYCPQLQLQIYLDRVPTPDYASGYVTWALRPISVYGLWHKVQLTTFAEVHTIHHRMVGWLITNVENFWKEAVMACLKVLFRDWSRATKENHETVSQYMLKGIIPRLV
jgi:hypothetical protein